MPAVNQMQESLLRLRQIEGSGFMYRKLVSWMPIDRMALLQR